MPDCEYGYRGFATASLVKYILYYPDQEMAALFNPCYHRHITFINSNEENDIPQDTRKKNSNSKSYLKKLPPHLQNITQRAAGIDIGSRSHFVAVPEGFDEVSVREFQSFTEGLHELIAWLKKCRIETVAMESTGVYWIPLYELLESNGFDVKLVDARHVKNVSGRKTDVLDCQWLQQLHTFGLLQGAFRPKESICALRASCCRQNCGRYFYCYFTHNLLTFLCRISILRIFLYIGERFYAKKRNRVSGDN